MHARDKRAISFIRMHVRVGLHIYDIVYEHFMKQSYDKYKNLLKTYRKYFRRIMFVKLARAIPSGAVDKGQLLYVKYGYTSLFITSNPPPPHPHPYSVFEQGTALVLQCVVNGIYASERLSLGRKN